MPRNTYTVGTSNTPVKVSAPGFGSGLRQRRSRRERQHRHRHDDPCDCQASPLLPDVLIRRRHSAHVVTSESNRHQLAMLSRFARGTPSLQLQIARRLYSRKPTESESVQKFRDVRGDSEPAAAGLHNCRLPMRTIHLRVHFGHLAETARLHRPPIATAADQQKCLDSMLSQTFMSSCGGQAAWISGQLPDNLRSGGTTRANEPARRLAAFVLVCLDSRGTCSGAGTDRCCCTTEQHRGATTGRHHAFLTARRRGLRRCRADHRGCRAHHGDAGGAARRRGPGHDPRRCSSSVRSGIRFTRTR